MPRKIARAWFALTALVVLVALITQVIVTAGATDGYFPTVGGRLANLFCFFTVQSNVLVGLTSALLAIRPDRPSTLFRGLRLTAVLGITVTGVVYHAVLADLLDLRGAALFADILLHTVSPVLCLLGWLLFGPRGAVSGRIVALTAVFPLVWLAFTLIRGAVIDHYPYPFVDVLTLGYPAVLRNCLLVSLLFLALAAAAFAVDRFLTRRTTPAQPSTVD